MGQLFFFFIIIIEIDYAYTTFAIIVNVLAFFKTQKQICFNKKIQRNLKLKNIYHHSTFIQYKKIPSIYSLYRMKQILHKRKGKQFKREKKLI